MLVLTRRVGETIRITDDIHVTILGVSGNQVRVGIAAPKNVAVHREEIYARIEAEKALAKGPRRVASAVVPMSDGRRRPQLTLSRATASTKEPAEPAGDGPSLSRSSR